MTSSQLLTSCMFWFTSHTFPEFTSLRTTRSRFTRNTYDGDADAFGTSTVLSLASSTQSRTYLFAPDHAACTHPPSCTGSRRHPLPAKGHRPRRRTIQRLQQQRLRRRHRHRIRRRAGLLQLRIPRIRDRHLAPARQEQLPPARVQGPPAHPPPPPPAGPRRPSAPPRCPGLHVEAVPPASTAVTRDPARISDPRCKSGHPNPPPTPSRGRRPAPAHCSPDQNRSPSTATTPTPSPSPHPSPQ